MKLVNGMLCHFEIFLKIISPCASYVYYSYSYFMHNTKYIPSCEAVFHMYTHTHTHTYTHTGTGNLQMQFTQVISN